MFTPKFPDEIRRHLLYSSNQINKRVEELGLEISKDYKGKNFVVIGVMKGAFVFMADLVRELKNTEPVMDFITVSSYKGTESSGDPIIEKDVKVDVTNKDILIVEDIVDNGYCIQTLLKHLSTKSPKSIKICSLLSKPSRRKVEVKIDYLGYEIEDKWVEGYGLDTDQKYRHLPDIWYRAN